MTHYDDGGNVRVEFVWGNMPMQPDDDRMEGLDGDLDNHSTAIYGYGNFPGFIPDYAGDEDSGLEAVVPDILRKTREQAVALLEAVNLNDRFNDHYLTVSGMTSTGTTVRVYSYNTNASGGGYPEAYLNGLRVGDKVIIDDNLYQNTNEVTVTEVNEDGESSWFEFTSATELNIDEPCDGTVYAGSNLEDVITLQRGWNQPGDIRDEYTNIYARYFGSW